MMCGQSYEENKHIHDNISLSLSSRIRGNIYYNRTILKIDFIYSAV